MKGTSQGPVISNFKDAVILLRLLSYYACQSVATRLATCGSEETLQYYPLFVFPDTRNFNDIFPLHDITKKPVSHLLVIEC